MAGTVLGTALVGITASPASAYCTSGMVKWQSSGTKSLAANTNFPSGLRNGLKGGLTQWNRTGSGLRYAAPTYTGGWQIYTFRASYSYSSVMGAAPGYAATQRVGSRHTGGTLYLSNRFRWVNASQDISAGKADVQTVVVHEVGHFTGLAHPWRPHCSDGTAYTAAEKASVMTAIGTGTRRNLNSDDIAGVKALY
ncbi:MULTISPECIES: matrixin family metalloprotease [Streptomyces]|uniref:matrixin family metalloprotease n=1 Tax=Streptomyces TaxID=1883 RepID=UPI001BEC37F6|nr:matrixin family metalloprotease [Streptomyces sp. ISL-1]MBT2389346.1 matrixin family metalloprotease [Streptomyces sp. ISL-1]